MKNRILHTRAARRELLAATMLATPAMSPLAPALAQTADTPPAESSGGAIALPTVEVTATQGGDPTGTGPGESGGRFTGYNAVSATAALKDNAPILHTPVAIQVVPRETLDDQQAISVTDALVGNVSSVYEGTSPFITSFRVRGLVDTQDQIYYNGLSVGNIVNFDTSTAQSFQVLKGPAAILYGRVEPGGIIYVETKRPQEVPYYSIQELAGAFGLTRTTVDATGPLTADKTLLYRLNLDVGRADSFVDFVGSQNLFVSPAITYHPIEQFTFNIHAFYQRNKQVDYSSGDVAIGNRPAVVPVSRYLEDPTFTRNAPTFNQVELVNYDWTLDLNQSWSVTNRFVYYDQREYLAQGALTPSAPSSHLAPHLAPASIR